MPESFLQWDPAQTAHHLSAETTDDITSAFIDNNIDGSLLPFLTTEHLRELGISSLGARLRVKRKINDLIAASFTDVASLAAGAKGNAVALNAININSNYVSMEALSLCSYLLQDVVGNSRRSGAKSSDFERLNENFNKLKTDLNPVLRLLKEKKPLPTPTLDPSSAPSPTQSVSSTIHSASLWASDSDGGTTPTTATTLVLPNTSPLKQSFSANSPSSGSSNSPLPHESGQQKSPSRASYKPVASPTQSNRFSSGSVLSMGVGKVTDIKSGQATRFYGKNRDDDAGEYPSLHSSENTLRSKPSSSHINSSTQSLPRETSQPLKQLKASSDDTCLKVLQHAMKRHHIPREKWSKYVLVVCYGDKERILKLTEKPVIIFKELQEHGKNPTIMLRERSDDSTYADSRIGDDIPGGTL